MSQQESVPQGNPACPHWGVLTLIESAAARTFSEERLDCVPQQGPMDNEAGCAALAAGAVGIAVARRAMEGLCGGTCPGPEQGSCPNPDQAARVLDLVAQHFGRRPIVVNKPTVTIKPSEVRLPKALKLTVNTED